MDDGSGIVSSLEVLQRHEIAPEAAFPFEVDGWVPEDVNAIEDRKFLVEKFASYYGHFSERQLKQLLASGVAPVIGFRFSARSVEENWIRPEPLSMMGHAAVLVGYGVGVDPFDLRRKTYFLVRDSFAPAAIHYRIAADELTPLIEVLAKVLSIKILDQPQNY